MEEFLLSAVLTGDELNIVHEKQVGIPILVAELDVVALFQCCNQFIGKLIAFYVDNMEVR